MLVVGSSGQLGSACVRKILATHKPVRALVRDKASAERLTAAGAEIAFGDLTQPETLHAACKGIDVVVATANAAIPSRTKDTIASVDGQGYRNLIDAAVSAGVRRFVYTSASVIKYDLPFFRCKRETEALLASSGLEFVAFRAAAFMDTVFCMLGSDIPVRASEGATVLRPYAFASNHFARIRNGIEKDRVALVPGSGECRHSFICVDDVAAFLVSAVDRGPKGIYQIGGPQPLSFLDVVRIYEELLDCRLHVKRTPAWIFRTMAAVFGPFSPTASNLMWLNYIAATEESVWDSTEVAAAFKVQLTSAEDFLRAKANKSLLAGKASA